MKDKKQNPEKEVEKNLSLATILKKQTLEI